MSLRVWGLSAALLAALACGSDPVPQGPAEKQGPPEAEPQLAPVEAKPELALESCKVTVEGGDDLRSAMVGTKSKLVDAIIVDGHELSFECPPVAERGDADIVAERSTHKIVHWPHVNLDPDGRNYARVSMKDSRVGLPTDWSDDRVEQYRVEHPDLPIWDQPTNEDAEPKEPPPRPPKFPVTFLAHQLGEADVSVLLDGGKRRRGSLAPKWTTRLPAGNYGLEIQRVENGDWLEAGGFEIDGEHETYTVKMKDNPLRAELSPD